MVQILICISSIKAVPLHVCTVKRLNYFILVHFCIAAHDIQLSAELPLAGVILLAKEGNQQQARAASCLSGCHGPAGLESAQHHAQEVRQVSCFCTIQCHC